MTIRNEEDKNVNHSVTGGDIPERMELGGASAVATAYPEPSDATAYPEPSDSTPASYATASLAPSNSAPVVSYASADPALAPPTPEYIAMQQKIRLRKIGMTLFSFVPFLFAIYFLRNSFTDDV
jgi:hypothetical protein